MSTSEGHNFVNRLANVPTASQALPPIAVQDNAGEQDNALGARLKAAVRRQPPHDQQQQCRGGSRRGAP
jgi:hypothetical protein